MSIADWLFRCDLWLLLGMNGSESALVDGLFWAITKTATWIPLYVALLWVVLKNRPLRLALLLVVMAAVVVLVCDQVASGLCKVLFQRPRPTHDPIAGPLIDVVNGYRGGPYGFFSSHAANTFGIATFFSLILHSRRVSTMLFLWAALSSYSRLYLGVHYPSDIAVGALFGYAAGRLACRAYYALAARFMPPPVVGRVRHAWVLGTGLGVSGLVIIVKAICHALAA